MKKIYLIYFENSGSEELDLVKNSEENKYLKLLQSNYTHIDYNYFDKAKTRKSLKKIIDHINYSNKLNIVLVTNKKDLFEYFNGTIFVTTLKDYFDNKVPLVFNSNDLMFFKKINNFKWSEKIDFMCHDSRNQLLHKIHIKLRIFSKYNEIFNVNYKTLIKNTGYKNIHNFGNLLFMMFEDLKIFYYYGILTSRLLIVLKRLFNFNLNESSKKIGSELTIFFNIKSTSYRYIFDKNIINSDLNNKSFRGYKIGLSLNKIELNRLTEQIEYYKCLKNENVKDSTLIKTFGLINVRLLKNLTE